MNNFLIILIITTLYSFIIYLLIKRRLDNRLDNKKFMKEVRDELSSLVTQINETSDRNVTLLENRLEKLNTLISIADSKINILKQETYDNDPLPVEINSEPIELEVTESPEDNIELSKKERIILLDKQGISPSVIARRTDSTIGEVELIITLNRG